MDISIDVIFKDVRQQSGVSMVGGLFSPARFNQAVQVVNLQLFSDYRKMWQDGLQMTDEVRLFIERKGTADATFIELTEYNKQIMRGDLPDDYAYYISAGHMTTSHDCDDGTEQVLRQFEVLQHVDFDFRLSSQLQYPTEDDPISCIEDGYILVAPTSIDACYMSYFRLPVTPVWGYTMDGQQPVYDPATSTNFEWPDVMAPEIINRVTRILSVANQNDFGIQTASITKP